MTYKCKICGIIVTIYSDTAEFKDHIKKELCGVCYDKNV